MEIAGGNSLEQQVRERAYLIWEREGRPSGRDHEHWTMAEREIRAEEKAPPAESPPAAKAAPVKRAASAAKRPMAKSARRQTSGKTSA